MLIRLLLLMFVISCGKNLSVDSVNQYGQIRKSESCSEADLNQNYLEQKNLSKIYQCLAWDQKAPELLKFIEEFNPESWKEAFSDINQDFLGRNSKTNLFNYLLVLRNSNELAGLQNTFYQILEKDSTYSIFNKLLKQLENDRKKPQEIISYTNLSSLFNIYDDLFQEILSNKSKLISETNYSKEEIEKDLIKMLDVFSKSIQQDPTRFSQGISDFLLGLNDSWFEMNFLIDEKKLPNTISYVKNIFPKMKITVANVRALLAKEVTVCQSGNDSIEVNHKIEVFEKLHFVTENNLNDFLLELNDLVLKYGFWREVCANDKAFLEDLDTINDTLIFVSEFVAVPERFELFRNLLYATSEKNIQNYDKLLKFLLSEDLETLINFVDKYLNQNSSFSKTVITLLGSLDVSFFKNFSSLFLDISENDESIFTFIVNIWDSLSENEKKDLLAVVLLPLYENEQNVSHLSHLYLMLEKEYPVELKKTFQHIKQIYLDDKIYSDLTRAFSDKILFDELKILIKENGLISLFNLVLPTNKKLEAKKPMIKIQAQTVSKTIDQKELNCSNDLIRANLEGKTFPEMINNMPESCSYNSDSFMVKIYKAVKIINDSNLNEKLLFDERGVFSSHFLKLHAALFLTNDLEFKVSASYKKNDLHKALKSLQNLYLDAKEQGVAKPFIEELINVFLETDFEHTKVASKLSLSLSETFKKRNGKSFASVVLKTFKQNPENIISKRNRAPRPLFFDLNTFIELLYDLSDPGLNEKVTLKEKGLINVLELNPLEMIERSFENMQFSHNHYAAYAVNKLSSAYEFDKELRKFQGNLRKMRFSFSLFSRLNYVEYEDREKIENLNETFDAFWYLNSKTPKYGNQSYVSLIQNLLKAVVNVSDDNQKSLKLLTRPKKETESGHAVISLIEIMSNKTLSQLATFLKLNIAPTKEDFFTDENLALLEFLQTNLQDADLLDFIDEFLSETSLGEISLSSDTLRTAFYGAKLISQNKNVSLIDLIKLIDIKAIPFEEIELLTPVTSSLLQNLSKNVDFKDAFKGFYKLDRVRGMIDFLSKTDWKSVTPFTVTVHSKSNLLKIVNAYRFSFQDNLGTDSPLLIYSFLDSLMGDKKAYPLDEVLFIILDAKGENLEEFLNAMKKKVTVLIQ